MRPVKLHGLETRALARAVNKKTKQKLAELIKFDLWTG